MPVLVDSPPKPHALLLRGLAHLSLAPPLTRFSPAAPRTPFVDETRVAYRFRVLKQSAR